MKHQSTRQDIQKVSKELVLIGKDSFDVKKPIMVISFLTNFHMTFNSADVHDGAAILLLFYFLPWQHQQFPSNVAEQTRVRTLVQEHEGPEDYIVPVIYELHSQHVREGVSRQRC